MRKIWERDRLYSFLRYYVDICTRASYRRLSCQGALPDEKAVLICPNHTNTLMDALVILQSRHDPTVFGARADIFSQPAVARILRFLKILPMVRRRDGIRNVLRNYETMEEVQDVLANETPFCMFPEGTHTPGRTLQPLQKGVARMAFQSAAQRPTWVVPVGINYSDFFHYRGTCDIAYGQPIDVNGFLSQRETLAEGARYQAFLEELSSRMQALIKADVPQTRPHLLLRALICLLWLPAALFSLPMWLTAELICKRKVKDRAFHNTVRFGSRLVLTPLLFILYGVLMFCFLHWWLAAGLLLFFLFSYSIFYDGLNLLCNKKK
ncbi:MAG: 1-acyl-sn-glycerol-3-phosphate acyltransferase [Bacteroidales bacterium]|nr:1-acyl-sn-glycerol-3-phosphate acyltransferase [Bacteroidales bacterium]